MRTRRSFVTQGMVLASAPAILGQKAKAKWRVGVIGHTGRGNFGHGLDMVWNLLEETTITSVADADPRGLAKAKKRLQVEKAFTDYREMLAKEKP
ncbi:MAG: gfo/Idh/MocA family oxidoreductase, partial [Opitutae bacterium]|nr:gfo/Idh/MocA family oxidoreductase [Opitutae bacterium]